MQFTVSVVVYSLLSLAFPARETFIPEAITSDSEVNYTYSSDDRSSRHEKQSVSAEVSPVA